VVPREPAEGRAIREPDLRRGASHPYHVFVERIAMTTKVNKATVNSQAILSELGFG
jgi:hypothetical protein